MNRAAQIANQLLEADEEIDPKDYIMSHPPRLPPRPSDVKFYLWVEPEDREPDWDDGGEPEAHAAQMLDIQRRLERGDYWAFGSAFVVAKYTDPNTGEEYYGDDVLGGCNYASRKDFMQPGDYFDDMKSEAYDRLLKRFEKHKTGPRHEALTPPEMSEVPKRYSQLKP
jgi:hypothetical protein